MYIQVERDAVYVDIGWCIPVPAVPVTCSFVAMLPDSFYKLLLSTGRGTDTPNTKTIYLITIAYPCSGYWPFVMRKIARKIIHMKLFASKLLRLFIHLIYNSDTHLPQKGWLSWILVNIGQIGISFCENKCLTKCLILFLDGPSFRFVFSQVWRSETTRCYAGSITGGPWFIWPAGAMRRSLTPTKEAGFLVQKSWYEQILSHTYSYYKIMGSVENDLNL